MRANRIVPPWTFGDPRVIRRGCPWCGSTRVASVRYGLISSSEELQRDLDAGRVVLGGCDILGDIETGHSMNPERSCNQCGTRWGRWVAPQCAWPYEQSQHHPEVELDPLEGLTPHTDPDRYEAARVAVDRRSEGFWDATAGHHKDKSEKRKAKPEKS